MKIAIHIGAHCTDGDHLTKSLLKNADQLLSHGVAVPGPMRYRGLLGQIMVKLKGSVATVETQDMLIDELVDSQKVDRVILGHQHSLGVHHRALEDRRLYPLAERNTAWMRNVFPDHEVSFFLGISNIANFYPDIIDAVNDDQRPPILETIDPRDLFWSDVVENIRTACPDAPITVWCNEDTPVIWPDVMRSIAGLAPSVSLNSGEFDILEQITAREGMARLRAYVDENPFQSSAQRARILNAFMEKFARDDTVEREVSLPGWTQDLVDDLSENYERDLQDIASITGVTLLTP
ncbi:hypothetical protein SAMN04488030_3204 [Aliiroseovarius halocynthiae]|uniref:Uncharacterized protein n=1 Tax=Aliiroseovarius halocynthiae TaxID=985055 RepID=A0A545SM08_9RHOB|nr:hypothetical protein [Aliiroseovarius halocynthiae]TQV66008.1 hypothetical protein FIL88_14635 [Aliiroseovarius halocynthiae]SMR83289.1 hypothetical protein SAMN04488030_3204 [Aliiroseovarius halocynthiae]